jgi:ribonuclease BN (tRNA processing enzyme)
VVAICSGNNREGDKVNVYILGAAGWIPGDNETSSVMVECHDELFLLDAGTGLSNIRNYRSIISKYDTIHLILSHYHLDHTIGIIYLDPFVRDKKIKIYGPGRMAYPETTSYYMHALLRREFFSRCIDDFSDDVQIIDFPAESFHVGKTKITVKEQQHSSPSFRIVLDDKLIYATDTTFDPDVWNELSGALLLHECWDCHQTINDRHTSLWQLKYQLPLNKFDKVLLLHQNPAWDVNDYEYIEKTIAGTNLFLAKDGMQLSV